MKNFILFLIFLLPLTVSSQIVQIGQDLDGEAAADQFGISVSLNADGTVMAVGAINNDENGTNAGHVRVFQNNDGTWLQIGEDIDGEDSFDLSGHCVSLSSDGSIVAIGAPLNSSNGTQSGQVRVFENIEGTWIQIGADIDGEAEGDASGYALSLNSDGNIVAIGAYDNDGNGSNSGHLRVYQNFGGIWTQIGIDIDGDAAGDELGSSVSISGNGHIVAVSAPLHDGNGTDSGLVRVYENMDGVWTQIGQDINGEAEGDRIGYWNGALSLSTNGEFLAIGSHLHDGPNGSDAGQVMVFQNTSGTWVQHGNPIDGTALDDNFGTSVSISDDGNILIVGAPYNDANGENSGQVKVYRNVLGTWVQRGADIDGEATLDLSGKFVSLSSDSKSLAIGAPFNDGNGANSGQVRVFDVSFVLGLEDASKLEFSVYPIPTLGMLNISSETTISRIEIYNLLGQLTVSRNNTNTIDLSYLGQGFYFCKVFDEFGNSAIRKIMKR